MTGVGEHGAADLPGHDLGTSKFSQYPRQRFGDLLPLPMPSDEFFSGPCSSLRSRRSKQRVTRRKVLLARSAETVSGINRLAGFDDCSTWPTRALNSAQRSAISHVLEAHRRRAPPVVQETPQAALEQLLRKKASGYSDVPDAPGQLASYVRDKLSLPRGQSDPVDLKSILPSRERHQLQSFETEMLLSPEEMAAVQEQGFEGDMYIDPLLDFDSKKYHEFVGDLYRCKLLRFTKHPRCQVGVFMVTKKGDKQRLILDARPANRLFRRPPTTILGSSEAWNRLEVKEGCELFVAQEDVKDFFYRLQIDKELGEYFSLPPVDRGRLWDELGFLPPEIEELDADPQDYIYPCMRVLPMGFSWAFHLAHQSHMELSRRALPGVPFLRDRHAAPVLGGDLSHGDQGSAMLVYADNNNHLGVSPHLVDKDQESMISALHSKNLATHDVTSANTLAESLGVRIDGLAGYVQPTASRDWRLDRALRQLVQRPFINGEQLQVVVGHLTCRALIHRGLMSVLRHCYVFIEQSYDRRQRLWPSVAKELELFRVLMPLATTNFFSEWDPNMLCTDACLSGYAVMESNHGWEASAAVGRFDERWRFRRSDGSKAAPRAEALEGLDVFLDPITVKPEISRGTIW